MNNVLFLMRSCLFVLLSVNLLSHAQTSSSIKVDFAKFLLENTQQIDVYSRETEWLDTKKVIRLPEMSLAFYLSECPDYFVEFTNETVDSIEIILPYDLYFLKTAGIRLSGESIVANFKLMLEASGEIPIAIEEIELHFREKADGFELHKIIDPERREQWSKTKGYWQPDSSFKRMIQYRQMMAYFDCHDNIAEFQRYYSSFRFPELKSVRQFFSLNALAKAVLVRDEKQIEVWKTDEHPSFDTSYIIHFFGNSIETAFLYPVDDAVDSLQVKFQIVNNRVEISAISGKISGSWRKEDGIWSPGSVENHNVKAELSAFEQYLQLLKTDDSENSNYEHPFWNDLFATMDDEGAFNETLVPKSFNKWPDSEILCSDSFCYFPAAASNDEGEKTLYTLVFKAKPNGFELREIISSLGRKIDLHTEQ